MADDVTAALRPAPDVDGLRDTDTWDGYYFRDEHGRALTLCYETGREPIYGKPFHGWSCDCDECKGYDERGEPRPGEAPRPQASAATYLCGDCGHTDRGPVAELLARMTAHWRSHRA